ncbi:MAG: hypothetical protein IKD79_00090 [Oscillospiraceae bacterium]|nr:hypothetical protein [Oscillospiraceae bacterium]
MKTEARRLALGGVTAALCAALLFLGGAVPALAYACPVLAIVTMAPAVLACGGRYGLLIWLSASILGWILAPDREAALVFFAAGWYPCAKPAFDRLPGKLLPTAAKLLSVGAALCAAFALGRALFLSPEAEEPFWIRLVTILAGAAVFLLTDLLLGRITASCRKRKFFQP